MVLLAAAATASALTGPTSYPLFKQCDAAWGTNRESLRCRCPALLHLRLCILSLVLAPAEMGTDGPGERSNVCGEVFVSLALALLHARSPSMPMRFRNLPGLSVKLTVCCVFDATGLRDVLAVHVAQRPRHHDWR